MRCLALLGASGHGKVVADTAFSQGFDEIYFFDDAWPKKTSIGPWSVNGSSNELIKLMSKFDGVIVSIGNNRIRLEKQQMLQNLAVPLLSLIHPSSVVSSFSKMGQLQTGTTQRLSRLIVLTKVTSSWRYKNPRRKATMKTSKNQRKKKQF